MNANAVKAGVGGGLVGGIVGGIVMAMWEMFLATFQGHSFFAPLHLIGHTVFHSIPLMGGFSASAVLGGILVHMVVSMMLGAAIGIMMQFAGSFDRTALVVLGGLFGLVVGILNEFVIWKALDPSVTALLTPWVFLVGHVMFGMVTVAVAGALGAWAKPDSNSHKALHTHV